MTPLLILFSILHGKSYNLGRGFIFYENKNSSLVHICMTVRVDRYSDMSTLIEFYVFQIILQVITLLRLF